PGPEIRHVVHVRRFDEPPRQVIRPAVIGTTDPPLQASRALRTEPAAAMGADVEERAKRTGLIARQDEALAGDLAQHVRARRRQLLDARGRHPHPAEDARLLLREERAIGVAGRSGNGSTLGRWHGHAAIVAPGVANRGWVKWPT